MEKYAVLTGDIVKSRLSSSKDRQMAVLTDVLDRLVRDFDASYDLYRGDSFQLVTDNVSDAALLAIIIRAKLIAASPSSKERWDARVSVGIGGIDYRGKKITDSDGPAFILSGKGIDELHREQHRLRIKTGWDNSHSMISLATRFADDIVSKWSGYSAEVAFYKLLYRESQSQIAHRLGKSQPTINSRMTTAKLDLIEDYIQHVKEYISQGIANEFH